jgi:hypothetical protein
VSSKFIAGVLLLRDEREPDSAQVSSERAVEDSLLSDSTPDTDFSFGAQRFLHFNEVGRKISENERVRFEDPQKVVHGEFLFL